MPRVHTRPFRLHLLRHLSHMDIQLLQHQVLAGRHCHLYMLRLRRPSKMVTSPEEYKMVDL